MRMLICKTPSNLLICFLKEELEKALRFNAEVKERLSREQANSLDLTTQLEKSQSDLLTIVDITENLEVTNATNLAETQRIIQEKIDVEIRLTELSASLTKANSRITFMESHCSSTETERDLELNKVTETYTNIDHSSILSYSVLLIEFSISILIFQLISFHSP